MIFIFIILKCFICATLKDYTIKYNYVINEK